MSSERHPDWCNIPAGRIFQPVLVQGVVAVEVLRLVEKISVEGGNIFTLESRGIWLRVVERCGPDRSCDGKVLVWIVHCNKGDFEVPDGPDPCWV